MLFRGVKPQRVNVNLPSPTSVELHRIKGVVRDQLVSKSLSQQQS
jgi:hypothetical protein